MQVDTTRICKKKFEMSENMKVQLMFLEQIIFFSQFPMPTSIKKRKMLENQYKTSLVYKIFIQLLLFQQAYAHNDIGDNGNNNSKVNTSS